MISVNLGVPVGHVRHAPPIAIRSLPPPSSNLGTHCCQVEHEVEPSPFLLEKMISACNRSGGHQNGSIIRRHRKKHADVWQFRWWAWAQPIQQNRLKMRAEKLIVPVLCPDFVVT